MAEEKRREIGWEALEGIRSGMGPNDNPYPEGSEEHDAWISAWTDAFHAQAPNW